MYDYTLNRGRKYSGHCFLQAFRTADVLKCHIKDCFKINDKQRIEMLSKDEYDKLKKLNDLFRF